MVLEAPEEEEEERGEEEEEEEEEEIFLKEASKNKIANEVGLTGELAFDWHLEYEGRTKQKPYVTIQNLSQRQQKVYLT